MNRDRQRKRDAYRNDPKYRARQLAAVKARHLRNVNDPQYRRLVQVRKLIWDVRERIDAYQKRTARLEKRLLALISERDELAAKRRAGR